MIEVSVVLPVYNEADKIDNAVAKLAAALTPYDYEIIIAEDGSTDGTDRKAAALAQRLPRVRHLHVEKRQGRDRRYAAPSRPAGATSYPTWM